jgi:16S rRNA processing protein RimM
VHGLVVVASLTDQPERFTPGAVLYAGPQRVRLSVRSVRPYKGKLLVGFEEVRDRDAAEALRRADLAISAADVGPPPEGAVWARDIEGLPVFDAEGNELGRVVAVAANPAHDLLIVTDPAGQEFIVPMVSAFVDPIRPGATRVVIRPIPGLLPAQSEP